MHQLQCEEDLVKEKQTTPRDERGPRRSGVMSDEEGGESDQEGGVLRRLTSPRGPEKKDKM